MNHWDYSMDQKSFDLSSIWLIGANKENFFSSKDTQL